MDVSRSIKITGLPETFDTNIVTDLLKQGGTITNTKALPKTLFIEFSTPGEAEGALMYSGFDVNIKGQDYSMEVEQVTEKDSHLITVSEDIYNTIDYDIIGGEIKTEDMGRMLYISGLPFGYDDSKTHKIFKAFGGDKKLSHTYKGNGSYALLFKTEALATEAIALNGTNIGINGPTHIRRITNADLQEFSLKKLSDDEWVTVEDSTKSQATQESAKKEKEAQESARKEQEAKEREQHENARREKEARDREAREREVQEHARKEKETKEREKQAREKEEREAKEREDREKAKKEKEQLDKANHDKEREKAYKEAQEEKLKAEQVKKAQEEEARRTREAKDAEERTKRQKEAEERSRQDEQIRRQLEEAEKQADKDSAELKAEEATKSAVITENPTPSSPESGKLQDRFASLQERVKKSNISESVKQTPSAQVPVKTSSSEPVKGFSSELLKAKARDFCQIKDKQDAFEKGFIVLLVLLFFRAAYEVFF